jgi:hypothetical protein
LQQVTQPPSAGDPIPPTCRLIEVRVAGLQQLFNSMDPSPFRQKDLDPAAEEFIMSWARELPQDAPWGLVVHLERPAGLPEEPALLRDAVHEFFKYRSRTASQRLRQLLRRGRISLMIGLVFLAVLIGLGDLVAGAMKGEPLSGIIREGLLIGGWVAMWRPLEVFLYDWWPIRAERRLYDRLAAMPVRITYPSEAGSEAWRRDWPAAPPRPPQPAKEP